jgi:transcription antitermination protein NusB
MASNRHLGRIVALQTLYELDFRVEVEDKNLNKDAILQRNIDRYSEVLEDKEFIVSLVGGITEKLQELDDIIQPIAPDWPLDQIARIDRNVLRIGVYELYYNDKVPKKVVINEAVELAKSFGSDNSSKFINGVLGTALKQFEEKAGKKDKTKTSIKKPTPKKKD